MSQVQYNTTFMQSQLPSSKNLLTNGQKLELLCLTATIFNWTLSPEHFQYIHYRSAGIAASFLASSLRRMIFSLRERCLVTTWKQASYVSWTVLLASQQMQPNTSYTPFLTSLGPPWLFADGNYVLGSSPRDTFLLAWAFSTSYETQQHPSHTGSARALTALRQLIPVKIKVLKNAKETSDCTAAGRSIFKRKLFRITLSLSSKPICKSLASWHTSSVILPFFCFSCLQTILPFV